MVENLAAKDLRYDDYMKRSRPFVLDIPNLLSPTSDDLRVRWDDYLQYLRALEGILPPGAFAYAMSRAHSDYSDRKSPHDGWLERAVVEEPSLGSRNEQRSIKVVIELLKS